METLGDMLERNAKFLGSREAFLFEGRRISHGAFFQRARKLAEALYRSGMRRGDRIAVLATNCHEIWEILGAAEVAGYIAVPLNFRLAPAELTGILREVVPKVLVVEPKFATAVADIRSSDSAPICLALGNGPAIEGIDSYDDFVASGLDSGPPIRAKSDDLVYLFYTSGTTGRPKGVMIAQGSALGAASSTATETEIAKGGSWLVHSPQFHVGANGLRIAQQLRGGRTVLHRSFSPERTLQDIAAERINGTFTVASMLQAILDVPGADRYDLSSMSAWMIAGAPASVELIRRAIERLGRIFVIQYGMTEGRATSMYRYEVDPDGDEKTVRRLASCGRSSPDSELKVVDDEGRECPPHVPGEVLFRNANLFKGYWNNSVATIEALRDGWMHSGDIGYLDEDQYLYLVDRKKDMIISGGENIYSREVEDAVISCPGVKEVAVIGVSDAKWGEVPKAFVVLHREAVASEAQIVAHCRELIAHYKCPKYVEFVDALPLGPTGKIDKLTLRSRKKG